MLTALKTKAANPKERACKMVANGGVFLLVQPNGSRLWSYKFRMDGTEGL